MPPPRAPFPTPLNLPFQLSFIGIQSSKLITESGVGLAVAATRQNGIEMTAEPNEEVGEVKSGGGVIDSAVVISVSGKERFLRLSHDPAAAGVGSKM